MPHGAWLTEKGDSAVFEAAEKPAVDFSLDREVELYIITLIIKRTLYMEVQICSFYRVGKANEFDLATRL